MPSIKKCQAEKPANTKQVGFDFCRQPATFDNPERTVKSILLVNKLLGLVEMTFGLVNACFSLPK